MVVTTAIRRGLVAAGCVAFVGFFLLVRWALEQPLDKNSKSGVRRPSEYEIASGMSVRYRHLHAESVSFKAVRIRRRRMGIFTLGALRRGICSFDDGTRCDMRPIKRERAQKLVLGNMV